VPTVIPVTTPVEPLTVATAVFPLVHVPLGVASVKVLVVPTHEIALPDIATGEVRTKTVVLPGDGQELTPLALIVTLKEPATVVGFTTLELLVVAE